MKSAKAGLLAALTVAIISCAAHKHPQTPRVFTNRSYVDLQPGWRIRVVTPLQASGSYVVKTEQVKASDGSLQVKTSADFLGYESDYYSVERQGGDGVAIRFASAQVRRNDHKPSDSSEPKVRLFDIPSGFDYVRLLFLMRASQTDHDEAVLAARSSADLDRLTQQVEANPADNCKMQADSACSWIPQGIAVQPEKRSGRNWIPAV